MHDWSYLERRLQTRWHHSEQTLPSPNNVLPNHHYVVYYAYWWTHVVCVYKYPSLLYIVSEWVSDVKCMLVACMGPIQAHTWKKHAYTHRPRTKGHNTLESFFAHVYSPVTSHSVPPWCKFGTSLYMVPCMLQIPCSDTITLCFKISLLEHASMNKKILVQNYRHTILLKKTLLLWCTLIVSYL